MKALISFFIILLVSCTNQKQIECPTMTFDISQKTTLNPEDIECKFIALETTDKCLIRTIIDIHFYDNKIFVVDGLKNGKVFIFDDQGKFITQIGSFGNGPGEYIQPYRMHIDEKNNQITIADTRLNKLIHYRLDNYKYISDQKAFNFSNCAWLSDGNILWFDAVGFDTGKRETYFLQIKNKELNTIAYYGETKEMPHYGIGEQAFYQFNGNMYISFPYSPVVYQVIEKGIQPRFKLDFGIQKMPSYDFFLDLFSKGSSGPEIMLKSDYINSFNIFETNSYIAANYYSKNFECYFGFYNKDTKEYNALSNKDLAKIMELPNTRHICKTIKDYFIMQLDAKDMLNKHSTHNELNKILKDTNEESNPIICMFKFK